MRSSKPLISDFGRILKRLWSQRKARRGADLGLMSLLSHLSIYVLVYLGNYRVSVISTNNIYPQWLQSFLLEFRGDVNHG
jgi:hypothetical protein